ncbi:uncharacterized protein LOC141613904 [Silene latifolia]|uniref:uncharacterized protein LOC141613904 n=1 Tax=Silene latifolia TaxID=37657 RepID=UPI003D7882FF
MVRSLFTDDTASKILAMPHSRSREVDEIYWPHSSTGDYNVKSGYAVLFSKYMELKGSVKDKTRLGEEEKAFCRRKLWKIPGAMIWRILLWRIITNTLSVGSNFERRNMAVDSRCIICSQERMETETMEHLFRDCEVAKRVWACTELGIRDSHDQSMAIGKWIIHWINYLGKLEGGEARLVRFVATLWRIWILRNRIMFRGESFHPNLFLNLWAKEVRNADEAIIEIKREKEKRNRDSHGINEERVRWLRESKLFHTIGAMYNCDCIRVMVDAGWKARNKASIGWVAFTETGDRIYENSKAIKAESALQAEALGLREVIYWAKNNGIWHLEISSDCLPLVAFFAGIEKAHHLTKEILEDIISLSALFHCVSFSYIPRSFNNVAHGLACKAMPN